MMKEILTEEKVKQRWQQMEEMNAIWDCLTERQKGYLDGCMNTVIASRRRTEESRIKRVGMTEMSGNRCVRCENGFHSASN